MRWLPVLAPVLLSGCSLMWPFEDKPYEWTVGPDGCFELGDKVTVDPDIQYAPGENVWLVDDVITGDDWGEPYSYVVVVGYIPLGGPSTMGTYEVTEWVPHESCGLCIYIFENCVEEGGEEVCDRAYMADRATVTIHEIDPSVGGAVSLDLTDARMVEWMQVSDHLVTDGDCFSLDYWYIDGTFSRVNL